MRESRIVVARTARRMLRRAAMAVVPLMCAGALSGFALFHTHLKRSAPANGARLTAPPSAVELWFSEKPELAVTNVVLKSAAGTVIPLSPLVMSDHTDTAAVVATPRTTLAPGVYQIHWRTMSDDGHPARGTLSFTLAPTR